ncbi:MAG: hypothetical protein WA110_03670 [Anaerolineaceae bacterium]
MENNNEEPENEKPQEPTQEEQPAEVPVNSEGSENLEMGEAENPKKKRRTPWIWIGVLFLIVMLVLGGWIGYNRGIHRRLALEKTTIVEQASVQYELAYQDISTGNYENARQRIEYVIQIYPEFPGAAELLRTILLNIEQPTPIPTLAMVFTPTPGMTSTPDLRNAEETFSTIQQQVTSQQWDLAIENIMAIRQSNYEYRTVDVDGLYFIALRNRGIQRISSGQLEQGLYDLATAEQIGPLDGEADGERSWAELYLTGASYWDVNWQQAIDIFYQVQAAYPYMMDSSGMTAVERYRVALYSFGDQFAAAGDYCTAYDYYVRSLAVVSDPVVQATATFYEETCQNMKETPVGPIETTPAPPITETPQPPEETPTAPPEESPTPTPTP